MSLPKVYADLGAGLTDISDHVLLRSLATEESLGSPTSASFTLFDPAGSIAIPTLMDVRVDDPDDVPLFRGQSIRPSYAVPERENHRMVSVQCTGYERLLDGSPVRYWLTYSIPDPVSGAMSWHDDDAAVASAALPINLHDFLLKWWVGPGLSTVGTTVIEGFNDPLENTNLRSALDRLVSFNSNWGAYWIDASLVFHEAYIATTAALATILVNGANEPLARMMPSPSAWYLDDDNWATYDLSDAPDGITTVGYADFDVNVDEGAILKAVVVFGDTPNSFAYVTNPDYPGVVYAPVQVISAPNAKNEAEAKRYGEDEMAQFGKGLTQGTLSVTGYGGWRRGKMVKITTAKMGWTAKPFVIRSVRASVVGRDEMRYVIGFGDVPIHSSTWADDGAAHTPAYGGASPTLPVVARRWAKPIITDPWKPSTSGCGVSTHLETMAGKPLPTPGVRCKWGLNINGINLPEPTRSLPGDKLYLAAAETTTDLTGHTYNSLYSTADWGVSGEDPYFVYCEAVK